MYRILIVSEDFVLRKAVAFSLNDLDACVECADTVGAMLVLHRESPFRPGDRYGYCCRNVPAGSDGHAAGG